MSERISGIVLAGGKSRRMGRDKRLIESGGASFLEIAINRLREVADEVIVVTSRPGELELDGVVTVNDRKSGLGPIMGIYTGLSEMRYERAVVNPVDTPNITPELLRHMAGLPDSFDVVMPERAGGLEPLVAVYSRDVLGVIERYFNSGVSPAPHTLASGENGLRVKILREVELSHFGDPDVLFKNFNSPGDFNLT